MRKCDDGRRIYDDGGGYLKRQKGIREKYKSLRECVPVTARRNEDEIA